MNDMRKDPHGAIGTLSEFHRGWPILVGAIIGLGFGAGAILFYTSGLFVASLEQEIGLTRTQFGLAMLLATMSQAVAAPMVGVLIDKVGIWAPLAGSIVAFAVGLFMMSFFISTPAQYIWFYLIVACLGTATTSVTYSRGVVAWFVKARGLALGIALTGIGISVATIPWITALVIDRGGWQAGYRLLGALALGGGILALLMMRKVDTGLVQGRAVPAIAGNFRESVRSRAFLIFLLAFGLQATSVNGLVNHFVPLLADSGVPQLIAAKYAAIIGVALVLSRLLVGWLADHMFAPRLASAVCMISALGIAGLFMAPRELAGLSAFAIGCAIGAEVDLLGYFIARYFGMGSYGRLYGTLFAVFAVGSGISPLWIGAVHDSSGSYSVALMIALCGIILSAGLFLLSPRYPNVEGVGEQGSKEGAPAQV